MSEFDGPKFENKYQRGTLRIPTEAPLTTDREAKDWTWAAETGRDTSVYLTDLCLPHAKGCELILAKTEIPPSHLYKIEVGLKSPHIPPDQYGALPEHIDETLRYSDEILWVAGFSDVGFVPTKSRIKFTLWVWSPLLDAPEPEGARHFYGFPRPRYRTFTLALPFYVMNRTPTPSWVFGETADPTTQKGML